MKSLKLNWKTRSRPLKSIRDILPLYCDGICFEDTNQMVEEHLKECGSSPSRYCFLWRPLSAVSDESCKSSDRKLRHSRIPDGKFKEPSELHHIRHRWI